jgi:two-component system sensor histidine kinase SenX3
VDPTLEAVLAALLGAVLGGGVILAWRASDMVLHPSAGPVEPDPAVPPGVASVLSVLPSSALVVQHDDSVVKASAPAYAMGLVRDARLLPDVVSLVHAVRRDGEIRETELAIGSPPRQVWVRVAPLTTRLVLVLAEDRTRERRIEAVRRDFVANVSHELKTPVGAMMLLAEGVLDAADDQEAVRRFAGRMQVEGQRLATLVSSIIELSRVQDDDPAGADAVDVAGLVARVVEENTVEATTHDIAVVAQVAPGLAVRGSAGQLALALGNLVSNAVAYSPSGARVLVTATQVDTRVELSVVDQGSGIPPEEVDRIFERFYRLDPARQRSTGGTGLGLSIVKHVAASHGGEVRVRSVPGDGSTFTLSLPAAVSAGVPLAPKAVT